MKNYVMKVIIGLILSVILFTSIFSNSAEAESAVYIPDHEYVGFFDHDGIYTVIAGIKNEDNFSVIPTLTVEVSDGNKIISSDYEFSSIIAGLLFFGTLFLMQDVLSTPFALYQTFIIEEKFGFNKKDFVLPQIN